MINSTGKKMTTERQCFFTLIERLVSKTWQICVYFLRKIASCLNICYCNPAKCRMDGARGRKGEPFFKKGSLPSPAPFTLIELLVVIAIIAILASMLLPALQQARERGKTVSCVSKVKTFSTAVLLYCENFGDVMPPPSGYAVDNNGAPAASGNSFWHAAFAALKLVNTDIPNTVLAPRGLFACPSETNGRLGFKNDGTTASVGNTFKGCHFGLNRYLVMQYTKNSTSTSRFVWRKITQVRRPSVTSSVGDKWMHPARTSGYAHTEINAKNRYPGERHLGSWNVATLDGSVKTMKDYPLKGEAHDYRDWFWAPTAWE